MRPCPYPEWLAVKPRFVLVAREGKRPLEAWGQTQNQYQWTDDTLVSHLRDGGNTSLVCGARLVVIDIDEMDADSLPEWLFDLPATFTVRTGSGGLHRYYRCFRSSFGRTHAFDWGEVRSGRALVACPGNIHPSGNVYRVVNQEPLAAVPAERFRQLLVSDTDTTQCIDEAEPAPVASNPPTPEAVAQQHPWMQTYPEPGERSEFDFAVCCLLLRYGVPQSGVEAYLRQFPQSKVRERGTVNYGNTWTNARRAVGDAANTRQLTDSEHERQSTEPHGSTH